MLTSDDLWHVPKTIGTIYSLLVIHHPSMVMIGRCLFDFRVVTSISVFDLCWPHMTFDLNQNIRTVYPGRLPIMSTLPPKYENGWTLRCWLRVVTSNQQRNIVLSPPLMNINEMQYVIKPTHVLHYLPMPPTQVWTKSDLRLPNYAHFKKSLLSPPTHEY